MENKYPLSFDPDKTIMENKYLNYKVSGKGNSK